MNFEMDLFPNLNALTVGNRDDGIRFTDTTRLDRIGEVLKDSSFSCVKKGNLYHAYAQVPLEEFGTNPILVSSHVDFKRGTTRCFSDTSGEKKAIGTYDNSATNAAIVELMLHGTLPKNTLVVFTGDEEEESGGASEVSELVQDLKINPICIILDVTEEGYKKKAAFTIENFFRDDDLLKHILQWMTGQEENYLFVPKKKKQRDHALVKKYLTKDHISSETSDPDESCDYKKFRFRCFSFCLPTKAMDPKGIHAPEEVGMHSNDGLKIRKKTLLAYTNALGDLINSLSRG